MQYRSAKHGRRGGPLLVATCILSAIMGGGCGVPNAPPELTLQRYEFRSAHMGTLFSLVAYATNQAVAEKAAEATFKRIVQLEDTMSDYQADSEVNQLCAQPPGVPVTVSSDLFEVLQRAQVISKASHGAFDVTIGPHVRLWRFARKRKVLPTPTEQAEARAAVGWQKMRLDAKKQTVTLQAPGMRLDLGGIAKGYASDAALRVLRSHGITRALVAASGDIAVSDAPPGKDGWQVAVSGLNVTNKTEYLLLRNRAVSTSGDTEQFIELDGARYSHIVSPRTGLGLTNRIQATVVAKDATTTDALATTLCILGEREGFKLLRKFSGTDALVVTKIHDSVREVATPGYHRLPRVSSARPSE